MSVPLAVTMPPYGSEGPYHASRLADTPTVRGEHLEQFVMGDCVTAARPGQEPRGAHASLKQMLGALHEKGVDASCCGTCCATTGLSEGQLIARERAVAIHHPAEETMRCRRAVSF